MNSCFFSCFQKYYDDGRRDARQNEICDDLVLSVQNTNPSPGSKVGVARDHILFSTDEKNDCFSIKYIPGYIKQYT